MRANVDSRGQFQPRCVALQQLVGDVCCVLRVHHAETFFQSELVGSIGEDGVSRFPDGNSLRTGSQYPSGLRG